MEIFCHSLLKHPEQGVPLHFALSLDYSMLHPAGKISLLMVQFGDAAGTEVKESPFTSHTPTALSLFNLLSASLFIISKKSHLQY